VNGLAHFKRSEFGCPDDMDLEFLVFLDTVRLKAGVPFYLTSDGRNPDKNRLVGGSKYSLHIYDRSQNLKACAVDWGTPGSRKRDAQTYYAELWKIARATVLVAEHEERFVQLEIVKGKTDWRLHLGLYREGFPGPSKLIVTTE
jgi:hypothetical protein